MIKKKYDMFYIKPVSQNRHSNNGTCLKHLDLDSCSLYNAE